jgi:hypothetical protein
MRFAAQWAGGKIVRLRAGTAKASGPLTDLRGAKTARCRLAARRALPYAGKVTE